MNWSVQIYIKNIIEYMERGESYVSNLSYKEFTENRMVIDAVIRCLEVVGEATKKIPDDIRSSNSEMPWRVMAGMRNKIIHS